MVSSNSTAFIIDHWQSFLKIISGLHASFCAFSILWEHFPEAKSLITCSSDYCLSIRAHCEVENPERMSCEGLDLLHGWIFPNNHSVVWITMCADQLFGRFTKHQVANLRAGVDRLYFFANLSVPKLDAPVSSTTTWAEKTRLVRTPSNCFDSGFMRWKLEERHIRSILVFGPHHKFVVISTWSKVLVIKRPLETADLLAMAFKSWDVWVANSHVSV